MRQPTAQLRVSYMSLIGLLVLTAFSSPVLAQNAGPSSSATPKTPGANSPQAATSRTQPSAPIAADAPRFTSSGLEVKIASFGVSKKSTVNAGHVGVTTSLVLINNNDYDVALLNVEGFSLIDNVGNAWTVSPLMMPLDTRAEGIVTCFAALQDCVDKKSSHFVPFEQYTVVSARSAIALTYFVRAEVEDDVGSLFTFSTKMMMYKVGSDNEIAQTKLVERPRLITIGIPNILRN